jgi:hypothetical protein
MKNVGLFVMFAVLFSLSVPTLALSTSQTLDFTFPLSPGSQVLSFNQFDESGGCTLTKVTLTLNANEGAGITAENDSEIPGNMSVQLTGFVTGSGAGLSTSALISIIAGPVAVEPTDGVAGSGPDFHDFGFVSDSDTDSDFIPPGSLAPFIGAGTFDIDIDGQGGFAVSGVTDSTLIVSNFESWGDATVTYEYTCVPEPGTIIMMVLGGLGSVAGVIRKIRR